MFILQYRIALILLLNLNFTKRNQLPWHTFRRANVGSFFDLANLCWISFGRKFKVFTRNKECSNIFVLAQILIMENKIYEIAKNYKDSFAFNISCISKNKNEFNKHSLFKAPNHSWKNLLNKSQSNSEFNSYNWDKAVGLGTFTGSTYMIEVNEAEKYANNVLYKLDNNKTGYYLLGYLEYARGNKKKSIANLKSSLSFGLPKYFIEETIKDEKFLNDLYN